MLISIKRFFHDSILFQSVYNHLSNIAAANLSFSEELHINHRVLDQYSLGPGYLTYSCILLLVEYVLLAQFTHVSFCRTYYSCCSVVKLCLALCNPTDCSIIVFPVLHYLPEFLRFTSIEPVMLSNHLILCHPLLLLPPIFPSIRVFSNEWLFGSGGRNIGASASVPPMNIWS